jgi:hypothetical protein
MSTGDRPLEFPWFCSCSLFSATCTRCFIWNLTIFFDSLNNTRTPFMWWHPLVLIQMERQVTEMLSKHNRSCLPTHSLHITYKTILCFPKQFPLIWGLDGYILLTLIVASKILIVEKQLEIASSPLPRRIAQLYGSTLLA